METYGPTIRYHCPLDCGWHYDPPPASPEDNPNQYAQQPDETFTDMITRMAGDTARLHVEADDDINPEQIREELYDAAGDVPFGFEITAITEAEEGQP